MAHCGSVQATAQHTRQSVSTVSHQLQCLERHLGVALVDHASRPMSLTPQGAIYLRYTKEILDLLEQAKDDVTTATPSTLRRLRFAMIEDFESDIGPDITRLLATALPNCQFTHYTRVSHEILDLLRSRELDMGVATRPQTPLPKVQEYPLLRDPFVLAIPTASTATAEDIISGRSNLPFLRYTRSQIMGGLIEAQLTRLRIKLEHTFELDSTSSILSLIAQNSGWAISTPSNFARSNRFHTQVKLLPFPRKSFARTVSIFVADPQVDEVARMVAAAVKSRLSTQTIVPVIDIYPWLKDSFRLISQR